MRSIFLVLLAVLPAHAEEYQPISDRTDFVAKLDRRDLRIGLFNLTLRVTPDGGIAGSAIGWAVSGKWDWKDGYFCRILTGTCQRL